MIVKKSIKLWFFYALVRNELFKPQSGGKKKHPQNGGVYFIKR